MEIESSPPGSRAKEMTNVPSYEQLMNRTGYPPGSSWGLFGDNDELGSVNFATPTAILQAARSVRRGVTINLDYPINVFDPPISRDRSPAKHTIYARHPDARDDWLDSFYLQGTTQIDALRHRRHHDHGFYNGVSDEQIDEGTPALGIGRWAEKAIVGRGILLDVDRYLISHGRRIDYESGETITVAVLEQTAEHFGIEFRSGDILMVRTGWAGHLFGDASTEYRNSLIDTFKSPGLHQSRETLAWLWDHQFSLIAADNIAFEAIPAHPDSTFESECDGGLMHQDLIALLGFAVGEIWALDDLAEDCAATGTYESFVVSKPLYLRGGVGSPANAVAIR